MRTLKFNLNQRFTFFAAVNYLSGPLKKQVYFYQVKRLCLSVVINQFQSILFVCVFQGSLAVAIIVIEERSHWLGFELQSLHVIERCNKLVSFISQFS